MQQYAEDDDLPIFGSLRQPLDLEEPEDDDLPRSGSLRLPLDFEEPEPVEVLLSQCCVPLDDFPSPTNSCAICLDPLGGNVVQLRQCEHCFHGSCLERWLHERRRCPTCSTACGTLFGAGPRMGTMSWGREVFKKLPGHCDCGTLVISFDFPPGVDDGNNPYMGRTVTCYLPDTMDGRRVVKLYGFAFRRRLLFSLGTSLSRGTYWPTFSIHLKTRRDGGPEQHGYPDPDYLQRVRQELADCGVWSRTRSEQEALTSLSKQNWCRASESQADTTAPTDSDVLASREVETEESAKIPCEQCGRLVACEDYLVHVAAHSMVPDELSCTSPESLATQIVGMVREAGQILVSGRTLADVCNFDIAVEFVRTLQSPESRYGKPTIEVVYHWTREENVHSIVQNNLRLPGDMNLDGSFVSMANGDRLGRGIYAAIDFHTGRKYGKGCPYALLCLALPGRVAPHRQKRLGLHDDSLHHGQLRIYRTSSQLLPLFLTDEETESSVKSVAVGVREHLLGCETSTGAC